MANRYWVGGTDNWNATAGTKWATTSGGIGGAAVPTSSDDVFFDAASGAVTVSVIATSQCLSLNFTGFTGTFSGSSNITIYGSLTLVSGMTCSYAGIPTFSATTSSTITSAGKVFGTSTMTFDGVGGTWTLQDDLDATSQVVLLSNGVINLNGFTFQMSRFTSSNSNTRGITFTGGMIKIKTTLTNTVWTMSTSTGATIDITNGGTIEIPSSSNTRTFHGGGLTYPNLVCLGGTGTITVSGSNTFISITDTAGAAHSWLFTTGITTTVGTFSVSGSSGNLITINSTTTGTHALVKTGGGTISCDYLNIQHSVATPSLTWYAGINSTDNQATATSGSGWIFTAPPTTNSGFLAFM